MSGLFYSNLRLLKVSSPPSTFDIFFYFLSTRETNFPAVYVLITSLSIVIYLNFCIVRLTNNTSLLVASKNCLAVSNSFMVFGIVQVIIVFYKIFNYVFHAPSLSDCIVCSRSVLDFGIIWFPSLSSTGMVSWWGVISYLFLATKYFLSLIYITLTWGSSISRSLFGFTQIASLSDSTLEPSPIAFPCSFPVRSTENKE